MMGAAQRLADQPADVVELRIGRREHPVGAHGVEGIEHAARPVGVEARRLTRFLGAGEALGRGVEPLLDGVEQFLRRFRVLSAFGGCSSHRLLREFGGRRRGSHRLLGELGA